MSIAAEPSKSMALASHAPGLSTAFLRRFFGFGRFASSTFFSAFFAAFAASLAALFASSGEGATPTASVFLTRSSRADGAQPSAVAAETVTGCPSAGGCESITQPSDSSIAPTLAASASADASAAAGAAAATAAMFASSFMAAVATSLTFLSISFFIEVRRPIACSCGYHCGLVIGYCCGECTSFTNFSIVRNIKSPQSVPFGCCGTRQPHIGTVFTLSLNGSSNGESGSPTRESRDSGSPYLPCPLSAHSAASQPTSKSCDFELRCRPSESMKRMHGSR
mmetsp:Transcript_27422/g.69253  ORF Transcript_27422/g.69253 Transcript_27422/m.69253 type:complete len:280 (+) Transcript_27422:240-1079(+)